MNKPICVICGKDALWCNACGQVGYCSQDHQRKDWKNHKHLCRTASRSRLTHQLKESSKTAKPKESNNDSLVLQMDDLIVKNVTASLDAENPTSMPKWVDTNSVPLNVSPPEELCQSDEKLVQDVISNMKKYGISVCDNFLPESIADMVLEHVKYMYKLDGKFKDGQIISKSLTTGKGVRGDQVSWIDGTDKEYPGIAKLCSKMDTVISRCQKSLGNYRIVERTKAMVACYPGNGTAYKCHVDNPKRDGRCITCIFYLNKDWDINNGGILRIYPTALKPRTADILPKFNRALFFYSDQRNPHEVLPAYAHRFAITCWYFDQEERSTALTTWAKELKRGATS